MDTPCRAFIVDDDDDMVLLTSTTIELANHGLEVAGTAGSGDELLRALPDADADVVVLDFRMPGCNGLEVAADVLARSPEQHIILFSAYLDDATVAEAARIGVRECVSKDQVRALPGILRKYCPAA